MSDYSKNGDSGGGKGAAGAGLRDSWLEYVAWACAAVGLSPAFYWLGRAVVDSQQLRDAFIILVVAGIVMAMEYRITPHRPRFGGSALAALGIAYAAFFSAGFFGVFANVLLTLFGASAFLVSIGLACFDHKRYVYAVGGAFYIFTLLSFAIKIFDLPLRILAGKLSAFALSKFNDSVQLFMLKGQEPQIAMNVDGASYLVATECNGFGIISSCLVLSAVLAFFRSDASIIKKAVLITLSGALGYFLNSMRIVSIVAVAPIAGKENYFFWHEAFGYAFFAAALLLVFRISKPRGAEGRGVRGKTSKSYKNV